MNAPIAAATPAEPGPVEERRASLRTDRAILARYTDQPTAMPRALRASIEKRFLGRPVQLYALADLDGSLRLSETWLALGAREVAVACLEGDRPEIRTFPRAAVTAVRLEPGLTCNVLTLLGAAGEPALARLRFTHRQRRAMENVQFTLEMELEGRTLEPTDPDALYAEGVAGPIRDAQALVAGNDMAVIWRLLAYLEPYRSHVVLGLVSGAILTVLSLVPPYLTGWLIDSAIRPVQAGTLAVRDVSATVWWVVAAIAVTHVLRQLCAWLRLRWMAILGEHVARDLRTELYDHLQRLSLAFYSRKKTGSLITRVTADTDRLWEFLAFGFVDVSLAIMQLIGLGGVLLWLDWRLGLVMTVPIPFLCFWVYVHGERMNQLFLRAWRKWSRVTDVVADTIPGMRVVKAFHQEGFEKARFGDRNQAATDEFNRIHDTWTSFWPALMLAVRVMIVAVWALAVPRLLDVEAHATLSSGTFVAFLLYLTMFTPPIEIIGQIARIMNRATSSAHRIFEVLDTEPQVVDRSAAVCLEPVQGAVRFENVSFGYDGVRLVIRGVTFEVKPGEVIGLVGPSGGGKTTVTNLLARFYDPSAGRISIDGVDLRDLDQGHYRRQIGMVLQDPYLFHGTVMENIRYGAHDASLEQVVNAARAANAHDFICALPHGYETTVGERGHTLSGGERQRVSIARAILHDPRILVLDEATSSVDTETEYKIQEALDRLVAGRTVFAIAHRLSTLRRAHRLFVIEDGKLTEQGTHAELLANAGGTYRRLHGMQRQLTAESGSLDEAALDKEVA